MHRSQNNTKLSLTSVLFLFLFFNLRWSSNYEQSATTRRTRSVSHAHIVLCKHELDAFNSSHSTPTNFNSILRFFLRTRLRSSISSKQSAKKETFLSSAIRREQFVARVDESQSFKMNSVKNKLKLMLNDGVERTK